MKRATVEPLSPRQRALEILARREQSQVELKRKLKSKGIPAEQAEQTVAELTNRHLQSDLRFSEMLLRKRIADGYGPLRIRAELQSHGIGGETLQAAIATETPDWLEIASRIHQKKFGHPVSTETKDRMKRANYLLQRGFPADIAKKVADMNFVDEK